MTKPEWMIPAFQLGTLYQMDETQKAEMDAKYI